MAKTNNKIKRDGENAEKIPIIPIPDYLNNNIWFYGFIKGKTSDGVMKIQIIDEMGLARHLWIDEGDIVSKSEYGDGKLVLFEVKDTAKLLLEYFNTIQASQLFSQTDEEISNSVSSPYTNGQLRVRQYCLWDHWGSAGDGGQKPSNCGGGNK